MIKFKSIAMRIVVFVIPTILITIVAFAALSYYESDDRINQTLSERMYDSLDAAELAIQLELYKNAAVAVNLASYAKALGEDAFDNEKDQGFLADGILSNPNTSSGGIWFEPNTIKSDAYYFGPFAYTGEDGGIIYVPDYGDHVDYFSEDWYVGGKLSDGSVVWSDVYFDPVSKSAMVTATKPFYGEDGRFMGVGTADMNLENIRAIVDGISVGRTGKAFILGAGGEYISFLSEGKSVEDVMQRDAEQPLARLGAELMERASGIAALERGGVQYRVYYRTMEGVNWKLAVTFEESEVSASTMNSFLFTTIVPVAGLLLVMLGILMVIRYLRRIASKVNSFADMAASGDFSFRIDVTEMDEFGYMEKRLNKMIANMSDMRARSEELLRQAESASVSKSEFLSRMSHEIRTPLNAIIGMTQIAKSSGDPARINDCLTKTENASKHLLALINDILDMSKIEANKLELANEEYNLSQTLGNIYNMITVKADEKRLRFTLTVDDSVPKYIVGDELRFSQVVTNLLGNAIKFTPEDGEVALTVTQTALEGERCTIQVSVSDSGIGMTPEQQSRLFNSFEQADGSISRKFGGTGLGLAISKRIVEMMGGSIMVTSEVGKGSVFTFSINVPVGSSIMKKQPGLLNKDALGSLKVLVVDDSVEANDYLCHILSGLNIACDKAFDGREALEGVERAMEAGHPYDIVFMDYLMPYMNGVETAQRIRALSGRSTAIIMVSICDWKDIKHDAQGAGILDYITKPVSPSGIFNSINGIAAGLIPLAPLNTPLSDSDFTGYSILLAEDIDINREIVSAFLEHTHVSIDFAENGAQAVEMFGAQPDKYDVILMDIQMPEIDGCEATRRIRAMDMRRARTIPIIAMTANAFTEDVVMCKEAGMNDHMAKPIEPDILLGKLADYFYMKDFLHLDIG